MVLLLAQLTQQVEEDGTAILCVAVCCKVNLLLPELLQQLSRGAWQLHAYALHAVAQLWRDCLHNGNGAVLIQINLWYERVDHAQFVWRLLDV
jgi:hypothetical protein